MHNEILELDPKGLREFGLITGGILAALFGLCFPWMLGRPLPYWPWAIGGVLALWALVAPATMRGFYRLWMRLAELLGRITTPVIMSLVFFLVITPAALVIRLMGRDPMAQRFDPTATSYRVAAHKQPNSHMERPF
jgi:Saxitoxin biosynthesis operon protein SxtJ